MTRDQFVNLIAETAAGTKPGAVLMQFIRFKAQSIYDPALEDNDRMQMQHAVKAFAIAAECLDDLVDALAADAKARQ